MFANEKTTRGVRAYAIIPAVLAVVVGVTAYVLWFRSPTGDSTTATNQADTARYEYQQRLNSSPQRFEPSFDMVVFDGRAYIRTDQALKTMTGYCKIRCGTVEKWAGTFAVRLPVGYVHGTNVLPDPDSWEPVDMMTFWNPVTHQLDTIQDTRVDDKGVVMPQLLLEYRKTTDLRPGETAYTTADFVRDGCDGKTYMIGSLLAYEPLGDEYGYTIDTAVTRQKDDTFAVKLPDGIRPLPCRGSFNRLNTVPVTVVR